MNQVQDPPNSQDRELEELLELLDSGKALEAVYAGELSEENEASLEILASLPYALAPNAVNPQVKTALLESIEQGGLVPSSNASSSAEASSKGADVIPFGRPAGKNEVGSEERSNNWRFLAMAASLAITLLGASVLGQRLHEQTLQVDRLQANLMEATEANKALLLEKEWLGKHRIQTTAGVADGAIPLHRVGVASSGNEVREAEAVVFICGPHDHWYLTVREMETAPDGMNYHLWFLTDQGPVHAGGLNVEHSAQTVHDHLPDDLRGILITLETDSAPQRPEGLPVLRGEQTIML